MVKVIFDCGGCDATAEGWLKRTFRSVSGRSWGLGSYHEDTPQEVAPEGWIVFDPYTGCTYCPECWKSIEENDDGERQRRKEATEAQGSSEEEGSQEEGRAEYR